MLTSMLRRTPICAPHRATLILARSKSSTSATPPERGSRKVTKPSKAMKPSKASNSQAPSKQSPKAKGVSAKADEPIAQLSTKEPASSSTQKASEATESSTSPTKPQPRTTTATTAATTSAATTKTTIKALRGVRINPEERSWHAKVVHGRGILEAYRHPRTHGVPVALIQFRAYDPEPIQLAAHFASHAAASLGIPLSGVVSLPTRRTLWTVPRGPFAHKKSQENFERRVHARAVKAFDADAEVVDRWVRYVEAHGVPGVGMRIVRWHRLSVGIGRSHLQSVVGRMRLGKPTNKEKVKELGDKIVEVESKAANQDASTATA